MKMNNERENLMMRVIY